MSDSPIGDPKTAFFTMLLEMLPAQVFAAGLIRACAKLATDRPDLAQNILHNSWRKVSPALRDAVSKQPEGSFAASALLVESYFEHRGDWAAMERDMREHSPIDSALTERVVEALCAGIDKAKERVK